MKKLLLIPFVLLALHSKSQWAGAVYDSLTHNTDRDEVNHQCIDIDIDNNISVVYKRQNPGSGWNIFYNRRDAAGLWSGEEPVTSLTGFDPVLGVSYFNNTPSVAFTSDSAGNQDVFVSTQNSGLWTTQRVTTDTTDENSPTIDIDNLDYIHLAWVGIDSAGDYKIYYSTNMSGIWETTKIGNSQLGQFGSGASPEIAVDQSGIAHIVYRGEVGAVFRIFHAYNASAGDTTWTIDMLTTPNGEDLSPAISIDQSDNIHVLVSGDDGFGFPVKAYYFLREPASVAFNAPIPVAPSYSCVVGDIFADNNNVPHCVMNEVSGNIYTGNVIYADSLDWNGSMLTNTNDIYEGNLVLNSDNQAYLCAYRGNTFADEEIIVLGAQSTIGIQQPETKCDLFSVSTQSGSVQLIFKEDYSGSLKCLDASGRIVFSKTGKFLKDDEEVISSLTSGVYFLSTEGTKSFRFTVVN